MILVRDSVERRTISATAAGAISFIATFLQSTILVPIFLSHWGRSEYGTWLAITALLAITQTIDTGHQTFVGNEINMAYFSDKEQLQAIIASSVRIAFVLSCAAAITLICVPATLLGRFIGVGADAQVPAKIATVIMMVGWVCTGSFGGILVRLFTPAGLLTEGIWWGIALRLVNVGSLIAAVEAGGHLVTAAIASSAAIIAFNVVLLNHISRRFAHLRPFWRAPNLKLGFRNLSRSLITSSSNTVLQLQTSWLVLLIGANAGIGFVPTFSTMKTLSNAFVQITSIVSIAVLPELIRYHARRETHKLNAAFSATWLAGGTLVNLVIVGTLPIVQWAYGRWTRQAIPFDWVLYGCLVGSVAVRNVGAPLISYLNGINHLKAQATIAMGALVALGCAGLTLIVFGFRSIGIALLVGDVGSSLLIPLVFASKQAASFGFVLMTKVFWISILSLILVGMCLWFAAAGVFPVPLVSIMGCLAILALATKQLLYSPISVRHRVGAMFRQLCRV